MTAQLRRYRALQLKAGGASVTQIAEQLGVSRAQAHNDIHRALGDLAKEYEQEGDKLRTLMMARYERLLMVWWPIVMGTENSRSARALATGQVLAIMKGMRSIWGIDPKEPMVFEDKRTLILDRSIAELFGGSEDGQPSIDGRGPDG